MEIYLLDMGFTKYGDCILVTKGNQTILIDAGHPGDTESIKKQIGEILQKSPPFQIDLLIITHCHSDHIGCSPNLIKDGSLQVSIALLADEKLGFGRNASGDGPADGVFTSAQKTLITALMEEKQSDAKPSELEAFLVDVAKLEDNYKFMITQLRKNGTQVVKFKGVDQTNEINDIEAKFSNFGLKVLGPTQEHLLICAQALADSGNAMSDSILKSNSDNIGIKEMIDLYKTMVKEVESDDIGVQDKPGIGAAKNNQSIVIKIEDENWKALLAGDMQFAKSEVTGLNTIMEQLLIDVNLAGPYDFIKLTHHTSYNGTNEVILEDWLKHSHNFAHTGGVNDPTHPDSGVLRILKSNSTKLKLARTDRNGRIAVSKLDDKVVMNLSKGRLNDFTANEDISNETFAFETPKSEMQKNETVLSLSKPENTNPEKSNIQSHELANNVVEVITKIPHVNTHVTITIDIDTEKKKTSNVVDKPNSSLPSSFSRLDNLIFITNVQSLSSNIDKASSILAFLNELPNSIIVDIPNNNLYPEEAKKLILQKGIKKSKGIVIIGGYDVVPSFRLDVLSKEMRKKLVDSGKDGYDADDFIIWSDDIYGDLDGDLIPEIPVSRIPDGRSSQMVLNALNAAPLKINNKFGIRNLARPFAKDIFEIMPGSSVPLQVSEKFGPNNLDENTAQGAVYFMLHGSYQDATKFWGETQNGEEFEAVNISKIPALASGTVVFSGCCWSALTVSPPACFANSNTKLTPKLPRESLALRYLDAGAQAFIGCTGSHYSPLLAPYNYFGKPLHDSFWQGIKLNMSPSEALFHAKKEYAKKMPHGQKDPFSQAVEIKILWQYTCLGLGW